MHCNHCHRATAHLQLNVLLLLLLLLLSLLLLLYPIDPILRLVENQDPGELQRQFHRDESLRSHIFSLVVAQRWGWVRWCSGLLYRLQMAHECEASVEQLVENKLAAQRDLLHIATASAMKCSHLRWDWSRQLTAWTMPLPNFARVFRHVGVKSGLSVRKWRPAAGYFGNDDGTSVLFNPQMSASVHCTDVYCLNSARVGALYVVNAFNYSIHEEDSQCTYSVTLRRIRATTVVVAKQCVTYSECVCVYVALGIQHAMHMRHIVICCLPRSTIFFHIISQTARFSKRKKGSLNTKCVLISSTTFVRNVYHSKKNCARYDQTVLFF
jgi:hypothetical protein